MIDLYYRPTPNGHKITISASRGKSASAPPSKSSAQIAKKGLFSFAPRCSRRCGRRSGQSRSSVVPARLTPIMPSSAPFSGRVRRVRSSSSNRTIPLPPGANGCSISMAAWRGTLSVILFERSMKRLLFSIFVAAEPELAPLRCPIAESLGPLLENAPPRSASLMVRCFGNGSGLVVSTTRNFADRAWMMDEARCWRSSTKRQKRSLSDVQLRHLSR
jgi:hypothetical protein